MISALSWPVGSGWPQGSDEAMVLLVHVHVVSLDKKESSGRCVHVRHVHPRVPRHSLVQGSP